MPFTTLKPNGIDLSQTFAFTGSVTGANSLILTGSVTVSSATGDIDIDNCISSTYNIYKVFVRRWQPADNDSSLRLKFKNTNNTAVNTASYRYALRRLRSDGEDRYASQTSEYWRMNSGTYNSDQQGGANFDITINTDRGTSGANSINLYWLSGTARNNNEASAFYGGGHYNDTTGDEAPTGLRFYSSNGNTSNMYVSVFGVKGAL